MSTGEPISDPVLRPADVRSRPCKVCGGASALFGVTDFSRSCEEVRGKVLPLQGAPVYYRRCEACGLVFTEAFDDWSQADFETHIYNSAYGEVDPDYEIIRPDHNAKLVGDGFAKAASTLSVLDYGGGNGRLALKLREAGFAATETYDPFFPDHRTRPGRTFDLVTCFETLEHMNDPTQGASDIASFLADGAMVLFSTLVQPADFARQGIGWWYIGPRNGHVTLHTRASLGLMWRQLGLQVHSFNDNLHAAFRTRPSFAQHLLPQAEG